MSTILKLNIIVNDINSLKSKSDFYFHSSYKREKYINIKHVSIGKANTIAIGYSIFLKPFASSLFIA